MIAVRVPIQRVGGVSIHLLAVIQAVAVRVRVIRIGAINEDFIAIGQAVVITVPVVGVSSIRNFIGQHKTVAVTIIEADPREIYLVVPGIVTRIKPAYGKFLAGP